MDWDVQPLQSAGRKERAKRYTRALWMLFLWLFVLGSISLLGFFIYLERTLPDPESIVSRQVKESTKIYDRTGDVLLYDIHGEEKRTVIPWDQIPNTVRKATLASEDANFYQHKGLDIKGILRSLLTDLRTLQFSQGGSTITQQLVKNALVGKEKTISRKLRELILAVEVEKRFTKDQIFWMYLNQIPYGENAYGIEAAAETYFGKHAQELSYAEAATLTALLRSNTYLSPYGSHVDQLMARTEEILKRMNSLGFIDDKTLSDSLSEELTFKEQSGGLVAPHFVIMARQYLIDKYGQAIVESEGLKITTTLDADLQKSAEDMVTKYSAINKTRYNAHNAALVAVDPKTGGVLALVGSSNYFDTENDGNFNVATARRQPGSSFKPFAYAVAFQKGYPDYTVLFDLKTEFNPNCPSDGSSKKDPYGLDCYHPQDYDGLYRGPVTMRQALSESLNIPSVKTLYLAGINDTISLAERMGITTLQDKSRFGLSLVLGGAEVRLVDLTSAYGVFANDGMRNPWFFIKKVELGDGTVLEEHRDSPSRVLDSQTSRLVTDVLSDNNARGPVFGYNSPLYFPGRPVAAKTGTTQENRDAWVIGYTPSLVTGVWVGNNDNTSMSHSAAGVSAAGPLWHAFMASALASQPVESFPAPNPVLTNKIMLNGNFQYEPDPSSAPQVHSILYYVKKNDPLGSIPSDPNQDDQFKNWEASVKRLYP